MNDDAAPTLRSGKGHRDENFPVASFLIHPRHRAPILAFYNFVRTADDIADHATLPPEEKLALLDRLEGRLARHAMPRSGGGAAARGARRARSLAANTRRICSTAFRLDVTKLRYTRLGRSDRLLLAIRRCRSAASCSTCTARAVRSGRRTTRCARRCRSSITCRIARKIIANLDRVYVPLDALAAQRRQRRSARRASAHRPALLDCLHRACAQRTERCLRESDAFAAAINDRRLGLEVSVINTLARRLARILHGARSARASACISASRAVAGAGARRRSARRGRAGSAAAFRRVATSREERDVTPLPSQAARARLRQLVLFGHAHPAAGAARGDVRNLFVLPRRRRYRRRSGPARRAARGA